MTPPDAPNLSRNRILRACRAICFPPFYVAVLLSLAALAVLVAWIIVDASFAYALDLAATDVGLREEPGLRFFSDEHKWDLLGSRLALLALVCTVGLLGTATALLRLAIGRGTGRSLKGLLISVAVLGAWFALFASYDRLTWQGMLYQFHREIPRFEVAAAELTKHWAEGGEAPGIGTFDAAGVEFPDLQVIHDHGSRYSWRQPMGYLISRQPGGSLTFELVSGPGMCMQFRPANDEPVDWQEKNPVFTIMHKKLKGVWKLKDHWFLVWYSSPEIDEMVRQMTAPPPAAPGANVAAPSP